MMTRTIINGKEVIRGVFQSTKKYVKKLSGISDDEELFEGDKKYLFSNNQLYLRNQMANINFKNNDDSYENSNSQILPFYFTLKNIVVFTIIIVVLSFLLDLYKYKSIINSENGIELNICIQEYKANECEKLSLNDGPILNGFCKEKKKCIDYYNQLFSFKILSRYLSDLTGNIFSTDMNLTKFGISCVLMVIGTLIIKILR